ncbi:hypothetical protein POSPLADRAFT_1058267 [Postia placenta MAD-698-R-SB12]|uniref:Uncharacterized protein n=1 Tax=Postia placenta MAD-698-R-SB12 TaxID=670580 RepID=A0A1X6MYB3_9APHY|nr:hypothetical protein POSPLADRAFT_1058267 [Postia placenta MAD-698-R-SB12]OSX61355.1 hypothetical protein POSPLADRAFT_1058267 [Postia placenta MAD-698-R-SB12]
MRGAALLTATLRVLSLPTLQMLSSQQQIIQASTQQDPARVAPYLTHALAHHGQLTLIPPQNAARIRKTKKKHPATTGGKHERRVADDEPRFTTAVPPASSRRLQSAATPSRPRKQAATAQPLRPHDAVLDVLDTSVPDYPPPSFLEAISSPSPFFPASPISDTTVSLSDPTTAPSSPTISLSPTIAFPSQGSPVRSPAGVHVSPDSPTPVHRTSPASRDSDSSLEIVSMEPSQLWDADRTLGLDLAERVQRERRRHEAANTLAPSVSTRTPRPSMPYSSNPATPTTRARTCSHCGSVRPTDSEAPSHHDSDDEGDNPSVPGSPYSVLSHSQSRHLHDFIDTASAPTSPSSASPTRTAFTNMSSPWASNVTLSFFGHGHKSSQGSSPPTPSLKRKESFGVRKLFALKGKEREAQDHPIDELDSWEVVESVAENKATSDRGTPRGRASPSPAQKARPSPPPPLAFVSRQLRRGQPQVSPYVISQDAPVHLPPEKLPPPVSQAPSTQAPLSGQPKKHRRPPPPPPPRQANDITRAPIALSEKVRAAYPREKQSFTPQKKDSRIAPAAIPAAVQDACPPPPSPAVGAPAAPTLPALAIPANSCSQAIVPGATRTDTVQVSPPVSSVSQHLHTAPLDSLRNHDAHGLCRPRSSLSRDVISAPSQIECVPSVPSTPTTPTSASGHHYPGRPLPRPPHSPVVPVASEVSRVPEKYTPNPSAPPAATSTPPYAPAVVSHPPSSDLGRREDDALDQEHVPGAFEIAAPKPPPPAPVSDPPLIGVVEIERRRVLKDGRTKLKISLLGVVVEKCGICLSQFKEGETAALGPDCQHSKQEMPTSALNKTVQLDWDFIAGGVSPYILRCMRVHVCERGPHGAGRVQGPRRAQDRHPEAERNKIGQVVSQSVQFAPFNSDYAFDAQGDA